jgi:hypothetical protein
MVSGGRIERTIMGNAAVSGELAGINDLEDLYKLDASDTSPDEGDDAGGGDQIGFSDDDGETSEPGEIPPVAPPEENPQEIQPDEIPHEIQPEEIPHE